MSGRIIANVLLWLLAAVCSVVTWIFSQSIWAVCVSLLLLLLPLMSWLWNLWQRRRVSVQLEMTSSAEKGQIVRGALHLSAGALAPAGCVWALVSVHNDLTDEENRIKLPIQPNGEMTFTLCTDHCGRLRVSVERLWFMDIFGFLPVKCRAKMQRHVTILPETFPVEITALQKMTAAQESDSYRTDCKGDDMTEMYQLREYVPGDNLHGIHWKLSSKMGQLVFREPAMPEDHSLLLCWDQAEGTPAVYDALAESVFSVGQALCEAGCPFTLGWLEQGEFCTAEIDGQNALTQHLPSLLKGTGRGQTLPDLSDFGRVLLFTGRVPTETYHANIFYCGEQPVSGVTSFTPQTCRDTLQRLDVGYEN